MFEVKQQTPVEINLFIITTNDSNNNNNNDNNSNSNSNSNNNNNNDNDNNNNNNNNHTHSNSNSNNNNNSNHNHSNSKSKSKSKSNNINNIINNNNSHNHNHNHSPPGLLEPPVSYWRSAMARKIWETERYGKNRTWDWKEGRRFPKLQGYPYGLFALLLCFYNNVPVLGRGQWCLWEFSFNNCGELKVTKILDVWPIVANCGSSRLMCIFSWVNIPKLSKKVKVFHMNKQRWAYQ